MHFFRFLFIIFSLLIPFEACFSVVGAGTFVPFVGTFQKDEKGTSNSFDIKPYISVLERYPLSKTFFLRPEFGYVFSSSPNQKGNDKQSISYMFLLGNISYAVFSQTYLNFGVGTFWTKMNSQKGSKSFGNGNSNSTYYYPDGNITSVNGTLNFGLEQGSGKFSLSAMTYWFQLFESASRTFSYTLSLNYYL